MIRMVVAVTNECDGNRTGAAVEPGPGTGFQRCGLRDLGRRGFNAKTISSPTRRDIKKKNNNN